MNAGAGRFADHFSGVAEGYAEARPEYPDALFDWIAAVAPATAQAWEPGCGSGQASRGLAARFDAVLATDPSAAQIARARGPANVRFAVEPGERCSLGDGAADAVCVAQALHWFDRPAFFRQGLLAPMTHVAPFLRACAARKSDGAYADTQRSDDAVACARRNGPPGGLPVAARRRRAA